MERAYKHVLPQLCLIGGVKGKWDQVQRMNWVPIPINITTTMMLISVNVVGLANVFSEPGDPAGPVCVVNIFRFT